MYNQQFSCTTCKHTVHADLHLVKTQAAVNSCVSLYQLYSIDEVINDHSNEQQLGSRWLK